MKRILTVALCLGAGAAAQAAAIPTQVVPHEGGFQLRRAGQPYFIKGAGGDGSKTDLKQLGANSFRTWGSDNLEKQLDEAARLQMSVTVGIWLGHKEHGFKYSDAGQVAEQFERAKAAIQRYKDHPAVLMWGIGNEMEGYEATTDPKMWAAVQQIAAYAHQVDPNHPTMTVIAEVGGDRVASIHRYCPAIDVVGINTYAGAQSIPERYVKAGGAKPFVLTEYGPPGTWELPRNDWGTVQEPTSTEKGGWYRGTYEKAIANQPLCLGGYAFTWGNKQEATATWYGLLLPDGARLGAADELSRMWSGQWPANRAPLINSLKIPAAGRVEPGAEIKATLDAGDPEKAPLKVKWVLQHDPLVLNTGGGSEAEPPTFPDAIEQSDNHSATVKMPRYGGGYRLFAYVYDDGPRAAVANVPLYVNGGEEAPPPPARRAHLPLMLYADGGDNPYIASGYMGNYGAIRMTPDWAQNPGDGQTSLKVEYTANGNWGGVVWQSPVNDWGNQPGGWNLTGARTLSFMARGEKGGEVVTFGYGLIGHDKKYFDTGTGKLDRVQLGKDWQRYEIDLTGQDLTRIKSGFYWSLGAAGQPVTFYLDNIRYETAAATLKPPAPAAAQVVAVANEAPAAPGEAATLPVAVYADAGTAGPFIASGYMGNTGAIKMTDNDAANPHSGKTALKVQYTATDNWGGVVWQSPANDWGNQPGGLNLKGARKLSFWARGARGGEEVSFSFGLLGRDKKYYDTASGKLEKIKLANTWQQYSIDLAGQDLTRIKTGFAWVLAAAGEPVTFYLDDIQFE